MKNNNEKRGGAERLFDAVTEIDHDLVDGSRPKDAKRRSHAVRNGIIAAVVAAAMALGVVGGIALHERRGKNAGGADEKTPAPAVDDRERFNPFVVSAEYPVYETAKENNEAVRERGRQVSDKAKDVLATLAKSCLINGGTENGLVAPASIYMALGILADISSGETQRQILDLLNSENTDEVSEDAGAIWDACYSKGNIIKELDPRLSTLDDDGVHSVLGASLWLDNNREYNMELLRSIAEKYRASSFSGRFGTDEFNKVFCDWLSDQTGGMLSAAEPGFDPETVFGVATTVYVKNYWSPRFDPSKNTDGLFHGAEGDEKCVFMNREDRFTVFRGDRFTFIGLELCDPVHIQSHVWFVLPDEGQDIDSVVSSDDLWEFICNFEGEIEDRENNKITVTVPKFEINGECDLIPYLSDLGVTDVFETGKADLSPLGITDPDVYVNLFAHNAHVVVDENGFEGAGISSFGLTLGIDESVSVDEFVLDRPFVFIMTNSSGLPLFAGVVNQIN